MEKEGDIQMKQITERRGLAEVFLLSNGSRFPANCHIIGISPSMVLYEGYDRELSCDFTNEEKNEIADYMISLWKKYKEIK